MEASDTSLCSLLDDVFSGFSSCPSRGSSSSSVQSLNIEGPQQTALGSLSSHFTYSLPAPSSHSSGLKYQLNAKDSLISIFSSDLSCVSDPGDTWITQPFTTQRYFQTYFKLKGQKTVQQSVPYHVLLGL